MAKRLMNRTNQLFLSIFTSFLDLKDFVRKFVCKANCKNTHQHINYATTTYNDSIGTNLI